ncbi:thioredoxin-dependent thiol peroxidase [Candidatus Woesearchaeota archaeon]|nr:thioredoxin-dependent thiol peroxidase [Candidatus Woesearchaeota archaeon]
MPIPTLNSKAVDFSVPDQTGKLTSLKDAKGKWLVFYFYPKDDTPGCTIEAIDFTKLNRELEKESALIWGVSPDNGKSHCKFIEKHALSITLLSDTEKQLAELYGVWAKKKFMGREYMGVVRSTFLIDPKGIVRHVWSPVEVKGHAQAVLEKVRELKK